MLDRAEIKKHNLSRPYVWVAAWLGAGFLRPGPGTWGSLAALPFALTVWHFFGLEGYAALLVFILAAGYQAAGRFDTVSGGHDNRSIVVDEAAGQWIALAPVLYLNGLDAIFIALSFALFRLFDITKLWPVSWFQRNIRGAAGVMIDDVAAGLMAAACIIGLHYAGFG